MSYSWKYSTERSFIESAVAANFYNTGNYITIPYRVRTQSRHATQTYFLWNQEEEVLKFFFMTVYFVDEPLIGTRYLSNPRGSLAFKHCNMTRKLIAFLQNYRELYTNLTQNWTIIGHMLFFWDHDNTPCKRCIHILWKKVLNRLKYWFHGDFTSWCRQSDIKSTWLHLVDYSLADNLGLIVV